MESPVFYVLHINRSEAASARFAGKPHHLIFVDPAKPAFKQRPGTDPADLREDFLTAKIAKPVRASRTDAQRRVATKQEAEQPPS